MKPLKFTGEALRGLFQRPATVGYPVVPRDYYRETRGHVELNKETCTLCMLCGKKCPTAAIVVDRHAKTWAIDRLRCIQCGYCVEACPRHCLSLAKDYSPAVEKRSVDTIEVPYTPPPRKPKVEGAAGAAG